eukprot:507830-Amphidinium_carterae.1
MFARSSTTTPPGVPASAPASATMDELLASGWCDARALSGETMMFPSCVPSASWVPFLGR